MFANIDTPIPDGRRVDVLTHFFIPYVVALFVLGLHKTPRTAFVDIARRENALAYAVVFGLAGFAPDLDSVLSWASHHGDLYFLQHRGVSHTLLFAPLFGFVTTGLLHALAVWRPQRFGRFRFRPGFIPVTILGAWTHLLLDLFTYAGVPLWWPFSFERVSYPFYHWIVVWLFPVLLVVLGLHLWGKLGTRHIAGVGAVVIVVLLVLAGVRDHYRPDLTDGEAYPRGKVVEWTVVRPVEGGYEAILYTRGVPDPGSRAFYPDEIEPGTEPAVAQAKDTAAYRGFRMGLVGPVATLSFAADNGTVFVTFTDVAARFEATHEPRWTPTDPHEEWGYVSFRVEGDDIVVAHKGW